MVIATQNPIEQQGTYPLPEAQLDRFLFKHVLTYPSRDEERDIVRRHGHRTTMPDLGDLGVRAGRRPWPSCWPPAPPSPTVRLGDDIVAYIVDLIRATRENASLQLRRLAARRQHAGHGGPRLRGSLRAATT